MKSDTKTIDLLQEGLIVMLRDKYSMSANFKDFAKKYDFIKETYEMLESLRDQPNF